MRLPGTSSHKTRLDDFFCFYAVVITKELWTTFALERLAPHALELNTKGAQLSRKCSPRVSRAITPTTAPGLPVPPLVKNGGIGIGIGLATAVVLEAPKSFHMKQQAGCIAVWLLDCSHRRIHQPTSTLELHKLS
jgi:hypothetical protein